MTIRPAVMEAMSDYAPELFSWAVSKILGRYESNVDRRIIQSKVLENWREVPEKNRYVAEVEFEFFDGFPETLTLYAFDPEDEWEGINDMRRTEILKERVRRMHNLPNGYRYVVYKEGFRHGIHWLLTLEYKPDPFENAESNGYNGEGEVVIDFVDRKLADTINWDLVDLD